MANNIYNMYPNNLLQIITPKNKASTRASVNVKYRNHTQQHLLVYGIHRTSYRVHTLRSTYQIYVLFSLPLLDKRVVNNDRILSCIKCIRH